MSDADISALMTEIESGPMLPEHKQATILLLNTKLGDKAVISTRATLLSVEFMRFYFTQVEWDTVLHGGTLSSKVELIARRCLALGYTNPTEKSFQSLASIALHSSEYPMFSDQMLAVVRDIKAQLRRPVALSHCIEWLALSLCIAIYVVELLVLPLHPSRAVGTAAAQAI